MLRRFVLLLCGVGLCFAVSACQKLNELQPLTEEAGQLHIEKAKFLDAIPAEYGDLISVTSMANHPSWVQAWFMRPDKSLVVVWINGNTGRILDHHLMIPRR
jgi:CelD/BcsL family acetyltransferase involved in cellulose biosynthesis